jgi:4-amino-4-deoxy-L-arabinose transferase-like glycosyltransferase
MSRPSKWRSFVSSDTAVLILLALGVFLLHTVTNGQYGFHRDELQTYNNALHLSWGYVEYPPMTPFLGRAELELFGTSLRGFRFFPALAQSLALVLAGLSARRLGGGRTAQLVASVGTAIGGSTLFYGAFLSYTSLDFPCWVLVGYLVICLIESDDARWWVATGAAIGLGMMTKYTMGFLALGVAGGVLLTPARRYLKSPWLWCGAAVALLIMLPNIMWQIQHQFITLNYLKSIHARDIAHGSTDYFLLSQLWKSSNFVTLPLTFAALWYLFGVPEGKRYRMLGWMYVIPLVALFVMKGRDYYLAPAYPVLIAVGAVRGERWMERLSSARALTVRQNAWPTLVIAGLCAAALSAPLAPLNTGWWRVADATNGNFNMQVGWQEMVATVAKIRSSMPPEELSKLGIIVGDDGEAGAFALYGPAHGLPRAMSGMNSNWRRGYGDLSPETVIAVGMDRDYIDRQFESCEVVGRATNPYGIENHAMNGQYADILVCRHLKKPWPEFWKHFQYYG